MTDKEKLKIKRMYISRDREERINHEEVQMGNESTPKRAKNAVFMLIGLAMFTKIFGFLREIVIAYYYGTSDITDVYKIVSAIPLMLLVFIGTGFDTGFIPLYNKEYDEKGQKGADAFMNKVMTLIIVLTVGVSIFVMLFPRPFILLLASGFTGEKLRLAENLLRISVFSVAFSMLRYIVMPYLQIKENFIVPALVGIPMNVIHIASFPIGYYFGYVYLAIGLVLAEVVQLAFVYPFARREGYRFHPDLDFNDSNIRRLFKLAGPIILSVAVTQINIMIDQNMASRVEPNGGIAALNYANKLSGFVQGLFIFSVISVLYPRISKLFVADDKKGISRMLNESMIIIALTVTPCMAGIITFSEQITRFLFERGAFTEHSVQMTSSAMYFYAFSLLAFGIREILTRIFYSMNDTRTPMVNSIIAVIVNIILNITLSSFMGLKGLALATSISTIVCTILLGLSLRRGRGIQLNYRQLGINGLKILAATVLMGLAGYFIEKMIVGTVGMKLGLLISIFVCGIVYVIAVSLLRIEEVDQVIGMVKGKVFKNKADQ